MYWPCLFTSLAAQPRVLDVRELKALPHPECYAPRRDDSQVLKSRVYGMANAGASE
jgi:hypothetical protein